MSPNSTLWEPLVCPIPLLLSVSVPQAGEDSCWCLHFVLSALPGTPKLGNALRQLLRNASEGSSSGHTQMKIYTSTDWAGWREDPLCSLHHLRKALCSRHWWKTGLRQNSCFHLAVVFHLHPHNFSSHCRFTPFLARGNYHKIEKDECILQKEIHGLIS